MNCSRFKALMFDCYGTLIDWETGILNALRPWVRCLGRDVTDRELLDTFAQVEPECEQATPFALYSNVLRSVHRQIADRHGVPQDDSAADAFARSVGDWPPFPDTTEALRRLRSRFKLVIVSNVDRASFQRTQARLGVAFDAVVTAEDVGAYKPDHRMFERAFEVLGTLGVARSEILHVAQSLFHDHIPAKALGMTTCWVKREKPGAQGSAVQVPPENVRPDYTVEDMASAADLLLSA
ncbi:MAG TPA: haloacid dehalogenase type II [candidate division Zixibacteria bacterium]|jgi:2-haloalkanoic acid dehalogenase type II